MMTDVMIMTETQQKRKEKAIWTSWKRMVLTSVLGGRGGVTSLIVGS
jgi:hypothetical protein